MAAESSEPRVFPPQSHFPKLLGATGAEEERAKDEAVKAEFIRPDPHFGSNVSQSNVQIFKVKTALLKLMIRLILPSFTSTAHKLMKAFVRQQFLSDKRINVWFKHLHC